MRTFNAALLLLVLLFFQQYLMAQSPVIAWEKNPGNEVAWMQIAPTGELIACTDKGLVALDAGSGTELWNIPTLVGTTETDFSFIPNTPFGSVVKQEGKLQSHVIFNVADGKVLCDTKAENILVGRRYILSSTGDILIQGLSGTSSVIALFDIATGKVRWTQIDLFGKGWVAEVMDGKPLETGTGSFIVGTVGGMSGGGIYCLSAKDGSIQWKAELPKISGAQTATVTETKLLSANQESADFYYLKGSNIMAYSKADGSPVWAQPVKQKGLPELIVYDPDGLIVGSIIDPKNNIGKPVISMYDYKTGAEKWEKPAKLDGGIKQYKYVEQGLAVAMETGQGAYLINIVDLKTGNFLYEKSAKLKGELKEMKPSSKGLFFRTSTEINILNLSTGTNVFEKSIRCGSEETLLHSWKNQTCYVFNPGDDLLYSLDLSSSELKNLSGIEIKFEQKESPTSLEVRENGILLYSSQNMILYDFIGKEVFRKHIPAPGESGWKKAILATSAMLNAMDAMRYYELSAAAASAKQDMSTPQGREFCDQIGQFGNAVGNMRMESAAKDMERMKARFKASAGGDNTYFMLCKLEDGSFGLSAVSKLDGTKTGEISFSKNKQPRYEVDDISKKLFYIAERGKIVCYSY